MSRAHRLPAPVGRPGDSTPQQSKAADRSEVTAAVLATLLKWRPRAPSPVATSGTFAPNVALAFSYLINGHMIAGHAMVAWPAAYADSGVETFICGENGVVYQEDLGSNTATGRPRAECLSAHWFLTLATPGKVGGLAQLLQRGSAARRNRQQAPGFPHDSRRRIQPAGVTKAGKLYLPAVQRWVADQSAPDSGSNG
jgi:hypothetical protein